MRSGYFDSLIIGYDENNMPIFDRAEDADFFCKIFNVLVSNGVLVNPSTCLQVMATTGMGIKVMPGIGMIHGRMGWAEQEEIFTLAASASMKRIDRVVMRLDYIDREVRVEVKTGEPAPTPTAPELQRDYDAYELALADIAVAANATSVSQGDITDLRYNSELCGVITGLVQSIDTTTLFEQYSAAWDAWFEAIKGQLSDDAATNLYNTKYDKPIRVHNVTVPAESWMADSTYDDYGFKADIPITGVTPNMVPDVVFPLEIAVGGDVAPVSMAGAGYVRIYATSAQDEIVIPTITAWKEV